MLLVTSFNNRVFGIVPSTGEIYWEHVLEGLVTSPEIAIEQGVVIAVNMDYVTFMDHATGLLIGRVALPTANRMRPTMIVHERHVYIGRAGDLSCVSFDGRLLWTQPFPGRGHGTMAIGFPGNIRQGDHMGSS
jgi:hypothetical protein